MRTLLRRTTDLTVASLKMLVRDRTALIGAAIFPVVFLLVFSLSDLSLTPAGAFAVDPSPAPASRAVDYSDDVLPGLLGLGVMNVTMVGIAGSVARFRETKVLRRLAASPVPPAAFIAGQVLARLVIALGPVVVRLLSGMFFPSASLPTGVRWVGEALPITPLVEAMRAVSLDGAGLTDVSAQLVWLAAWVPVSFGVARLAFRLRSRGARVRPRDGLPPDRAARSARTPDGR